MRRPPALEPALPTVPQAAAEPQRLRCSLQTAASEPHASMPPSAEHECIGGSTPQASPQAQEAGMPKGTGEPTFITKGLGWDLGGPVIGGQGLAGQQVRHELEEAQAMVRGVRFLSRLYWMKSAS